MSDSLEFGLFFDLFFINWIAEKPNQQSKIMNVFFLIDLELLFIQHWFVTVNNGCFL
jgi:hypothetical protein